MVKTYVLVDEETYERKFDPQRTRASAEGERKAAVATLPNPFQNPDARRAKQVQREMYKVGQDKSLDVDTSVRLFRRLMDEYESRISRQCGQGLSTSNRFQLQFPSLFVSFHQSTSFYPSLCRACRLLLHCIRCCRFRRARSRFLCR